MKSIKNKKKSREKLGIKPDHKTNEDFNQQEPRLVTPTPKADKQQTPAYNKKENSHTNSHPSKVNAQVIVNDENKPEESLETKEGDSDAERAKKEAQNQSEQKETD